MRLRWDRILALLLMLISPVIINWLYKSLYIGPFHKVTGIGRLDVYPEAKALALLGVLLIGIILVFKTLRDD